MGKKDKKKTAAHKERMNQKASPFVIAAHVDFNRRPLNTPKGKLKTAINLTAIPREMKMSTLTLF